LSKLHKKNTLENRNIRERERERDSFYGCYK